MAKKGLKGISIEQKEKAEIQLKALQKQIDYDTKDYPVELIVSKFGKKEFFVPTYQRDFVWKDKNKTSFIESVLLGLPIPFMFFGDRENGSMEIIDGAQRVQTLAAFTNNQLVLSQLPKLTCLKDFKFSDLSDSQQRRFLNKTMRVIVLDESTPNDIRQDIFNRINTSGIKANESEVRRGSFPGRLTEFIDSYAKDPLFVKLCPVTPSQNDRHERFELLLRFFAYVNSYKSFDHRVGDFLDDFLITHQNSFDEKAYLEEFNSTLNFIEINFPCGFAKTKTAKTTPRVRFEAISVGTALALRDNPELEVKSIDWIDSARFKELTTSDASNNQGKLKERVEFVRNQLLRDAKND
ncbi:DUF262 domain-containing protein [Paenibacillus sp. FSL M7-0656]|uniref:DUF262 domain-containing protein n=1 Tax=Paenibacillus sp. FSL M7-0656 TaxID=2921534 RepID=UPI0030FCD138